jgi:hypothetical protein
MNETSILITLLWMYIPRNWEFGSALPKLRNFGVVEPRDPPFGTSLCNITLLNAKIILLYIRNQSVPCCENIPPVIKANQMMYKAVADGLWVLHKYTARLCICIC